MIRKLIILFIILVELPVNYALAQDWVTKMQDPAVNFYDVQHSFNKHWKKEEQKEKLKNFFRFGNKTEDKNEGFILYKRWEAYVAPRVYPSGDRSLMQTTNQEIEKLISNPTYKSAMQTGGNWSPLGPFNVPVGGGGAGRLNCVRFHPSDPYTIYVGAPAGGLWKSIDAGLTWTTNTDALPSLGVNDIAIDATDTDVMYIATGDVDGGDTRCVGILKSIDGGNSWSITGLNWTVIQNIKVSRVLINPNDHNMLLVGASNGIYKSSDAGVSWIKISTIGNIKDMEFKPGDPSIVYATSSTAFFKSTDSGNSFFVVTSGLPVSSGISRMAIAVTPADPSYVYVLCSTNSTNEFKGLYLSTNSGAGFSMKSNSPNLLGWDYDGSDSGGQAWYTLSIAASPIDKNEIIVGGVNIWKSADAGLTWNLNAHWYGGGAPYVHADIHDLIYRPDGSNYYAASDGGLFETGDGGNSWQDRSEGLQIGQIYRLGCAATDANQVIQGWQDNGTNLYNTGNWDYVLGGDGMECFIDWSDPNYMYGEYYNGELFRSSNGGANFDYIKNDISENGVWITPWLQDPVSPQTLYAGFRNVWKSTDQGNSWTAISTFNSTGLECLAVAPSNPDCIIASTGSTIYKTNDGGASWTTISNPTGVTITYIAFCTTDENKIWISCSGYTANKKVFKSTDAGLSWMNVSGNLPNIPVNCIINQTGTNDGVYVGTDLGVYYTDASLTSWLPFSNGLPNVVVDELEIHYASDKLRAATYGRGLWETAIYNPASTSPFANFSSDIKSACPGSTIQFSDSTRNTPTTWNWSFPGGTPNTSTLQNPAITYNTAGTYNNVKLVVSNANGTDSVIKNSYIAISPQIQPFISIINGNDSVCSGTIVHLKASQAQSYSWSPGGQTNYLLNTSLTGVYSVTTTDIFGCPSTSAPLNIYVFPIPTMPVVTVNADTLISSSLTGNQWYLNGTAITGAINQTYVMTSAGTYKVKVTDSIFGCSATSSIILGGDEIQNVRIGFSFSVFPNPSNGITTLELHSYSSDNLQMEITDVLGRVLYDKKYSSLAGSIEHTIDLRLYGKGIYLLSIKNSIGYATKKIVVY